jgi:hypothetical protein
MTKGIREALRIAQSEGLSLSEIIRGRSHVILTLKNDAGALMRQPIPHGGLSSSSPHWRNLRANCRRFARGDTHGLDVLI